MPSANPRTAQESIRKALNRYFADSAPTMPVTTAKTAASAGTPPKRSAMPIATGAVTDFGASDSKTSRGRPNIHPSATALPAAAKPPASAATVNATPRRRTSARRSHSGHASATTAGPSRTCTNCAPAK